ncbi:hypothetical protein TNCT_342951 [Trichonephila clavata]|uniref:Uncharacterized protein n=1 Tax=Trichonephila clavata TaxID=2740835 RepID=A0A8X6J6L3_TRICU|nr:hypothetical protein TNCT_342951 [Trichonephila clavata]
MPPKKSSLYNKRSKEARCKRHERSHQSEEEIASINTAQIMTSENRIEESKRHRDWRLRQNISRKQACEQYITTSRVREREGQQVSHS